MTSLTKRGSPDRSKINMREAQEVQGWAKHLGVSKDELRKVVEKVRNGAAAVKKELAT
jgi:Protein of unknown function (DUF3606)